ncbi:MAG: hypothetical protein IPH69_18155 [Bacteroidales bacterium]|nr:hypothetical protein [Bacteroidales bacterium]
MTDNDNGYAPVGWKTTIYNGTWWRTGSFPGSAGMMKRQSDGICWVVLFNSSAWNDGDLFLYEQYDAQGNLTDKEWPDYDLSTYSLPVPLNVTSYESFDW